MHKSYDQKRFLIAWKNNLVFLIILSLTLFFIEIAKAQDLNHLASSLRVEKKSLPECKEAEEKDPSAWDVSAAVGFNLTQGNSDTRLLTGAFDANREIKDNVYIVNLAAGDGEQEGDRTQRFARGKAAYERIITEEVFYSISGSFISDQIADVDYRTVLSPAIGHYFVKNEDVKLSLQTGPAYVFDKQGGQKDNYLAWRVANNFSWEFSETAKIFQYADYLLNTENTDQSIILAKVGLESSLNSFLALVFAIEDRFNSLPPKDRKNNDILITSSLKVSF